ncbi:hypothetical protein [Gryllotalpicola sp.]|uniref:nucleotide-binding protein n=1 Tax=Gryllotalpicola sp. TaxID=1932787 RepID=UPI0026103E92|nr:hypothetical protein [Gryllotalpicola sp.]
MDSLLIAVWGPAGAPGRTTAAIGIARELARAGCRTVLIDADSYGGAVASRLGLPDEASGLAAACRLVERDGFDRAALAAVTERVPAGAEPDAPAFGVLTGIRDAGRWPELAERPLRSVLAALAAWSDVVVVDCGFNLEADEEIVSDLFAPRRNQAAHAALRAAGTVVAVVADDPVSVDRYLCARHDAVELAPGARHLVILNRVRSAAAADALERFAGIRVAAHLAEGDPDAALQAFSREIAGIAAL